MPMECDGDYWEGSSFAKGREGFREKWGSFAKLGANFAKVGGGIIRKSGNRRGMIWVH
jgi:hypothetical protein